jgi:hypothetical protein
MTSFTCNELGQLNSRVLAAEKSKARASEWLTRATDARADLAAAELRFVATMGEDAASNLAQAKNHAFSLKLAAAALEGAGGPEGAFDRTVETQQCFGLLAQVFDTRGAELVRLLKPTRKALGTRLAALGEEGATLAQTELDAEVRVRRGTIAAGEAAIQAAVQMRNFCRGWVPGIEGQSFDSLLACASSDLPI